MRTFLRRRRGPGEWRNVGVRMRRLLMGGRFSMLRGVDLGLIRVGEVNEKRGLYCCMYIYTNVD